MKLFNIVKYPELLAEKSDENAPKIPLETALKRALSPVILVEFGVIWAKSRNTFLFQLTAPLSVVNSMMLCAQQRPK